MAAHIRLEGNERKPRPGTVRVRDVPATTPVEVTVTVRHPDLPDPRSRLTRQQLEADHSVSPDDTAAVKRVLGRYGLTVSDAAVATGSLVVSGMVV